MQKLIKNLKIQHLYYKITSSELDSSILQMPLDNKNLTFYKKRDNCLKETQKDVILQLEKSMGDTIFSVIWIPTFEGFNHEFVYQIINVHALRKNILFQTFKSTKDIITHLFHETIAWRYLHKNDEKFKKSAFLSFYINYNKSYYLNKKQKKN